MFYFFNLLWSFTSKTYTRGRGGVSYCGAKEQLPSCGLCFSSPSCLTFSLSNDILSTIRILPYKLKDSPAPLLATKTFCLFVMVLHYNWLPYNSPSKLKYSSWILSYVNHNLILRYHPVKEHYIKNLIFSKKVTYVFLLEQL